MTTVAQHIQRGIIVTLAIAFAGLGLAYVAGWMALLGHVTWEMYHATSEQWRIIATVMGVALALPGACSLPVSRFAWFVARFLMRHTPRLPPLPGSRLRTISTPTGGPRTN